MNAQELLEKVIAGMNKWTVEPTHSIRAGDWGFGWDTLTGRLWFSDTCRCALTTLLPAEELREKYKEVPLPACDESVMSLECMLVSLHLGLATSCLTAFTRGFDGLRTKSDDTTLQLEFFDAGRKARQHAERHRLFSPRSDEEEGGETVT